MPRGVRFDATHLTFRILGAAAAVLAGLALAPNIVLAKVRNLAGHALGTSAPTSSSPIIHTGTHVFNVNPDQGTVAAISEAGLIRIWEKPVGTNPRTLAEAPNGEIWVVNQGDASVHVLDPNDGAHTRTIPLPYASQPYGIVFAPDGSAAYVTLQATHKLLKLDLSGQVVRTLDLDGPPRGLAAIGERVLVTRFVSPADRATVWSVDAVSWSMVEIPLAYDTTPDHEKNGRGVPNYLTSIRISPDGQRALVPSKKDNTARGSFRTGQPLAHDSRSRTIVSFIDLVANAETYEARIDLDDHNMAQSVIFSPSGDLFFVATQGTNKILIYEANTSALLGQLDTGLAPQGMAMSASGHRLYVHNFMSRSVSVFNTADLVERTSNSAPLLAEITTVSAELLSSHVLLGKQIFYNAADPRMSREGYTSCAGCHLDGGSDGQVWDFTQGGEGLRNTISLIGRAGTGHGNVHWTANFDEIQDFENDIRNNFEGTGFLSDADFAATSDPLGIPKAGRSSDLDALAAFVASLDRFPNSPYRNPDGSLTTDGEAGRLIFQAKNCASCHSGTRFTDGLRHDVGTIQPSSGRAIGQPLAGIGFETPTLKGLWSGAPYFHNGQAATLEDVLAHPQHGGAHTLTATERDQLIAFLLQIDDLAEAVPPLPGTGGVLVARQSNWKFHALGQDLGTAWRESGYDDATWASGPGVLGYGESYVTTEVPYGASSSYKHQTTYFRRAFTVTGAAGVTGLRLHMMWDDGFVAYLNGVEVARSNLGSGPVRHDTSADPSHEAKETYEAIDITGAIGALREGMNVLAVEVHQKGSSSSDMVFDAELESDGSGVASGADTPPPPDTSADGVLIGRQSSWKYHDQGQDLGTAWREIAYDDAPWPSGPGVLGYGESYVTTAVSYGPSSSNKHQTTYFRRAFTVSGAAGVTGLTLHVMWDDGFVAYLNGVEVARQNLGSGLVSYDSSADPSHEGKETYEAIDITGAIGALREGMNVLAVEVHQKGSSSSDMVFDAELESADSGVAGSVDTTPPSITSLQSPADGSTVSSSPTFDWDDVQDASGVSYRLQVDDDPDFGSPAVDLSGWNPSSYTPGALGSGTYRWRVEVTDGAGLTSGWTTSWQVTVEPSTGVGGILIARQSIWKYNAGQDLGTAWRELGYDDATWASGPGVLGYGESYVTTEVPYGASSSSKHLTTYFRRAFSMTGTAGGSGLTLHVMWDDGFVAYLNGVEVARRNVGSGIVSYETSADPSHEAKETYEAIDIGASIGVLREGMNVLAVEVHQKGSSSSDMIFDAELELVGSGVAPRGMLVPRQSNWKYHDQGEDLGTAWSEFGYDDGAWASGPGVLGYGESYVVTEVSYGASSSNRNQTTYFRRVFTLAEATGVTGLTLRVMWDDGFVAYLNGVEVTRSNLGSGPVSYATPADPSHEASESYEAFDVGGSIGALREGTNVLAVEVHQKGSSSSDMIFDAELEATGPGVRQSEAQASREQVELSATPSLSAWPVPYRGGNLSISFSPGTSRKEGMLVEVAIFDLTGRRVRTLANGRFPAGSHRVTWDGRDSNDLSVTTGIYFLRVQSDAFQQIRKIVTVR